MGLPPEPSEGCLQARNDALGRMFGKRRKSRLKSRLLVNSLPMTELLRDPYDRKEDHRAERDEIRGIR